MGKGMTGIYELLSQIIENFDKEELKNISLNTDDESYWSLRINCNHSKGTHNALYDGDYLIIKNKKMTVVRNDDVLDDLTSLVTEKQIEEHIRTKY
jgi:hypothetical protein